MTLPVTSRLTEVAPRLLVDSEVRNRVKVSSWGLIQETDPWVPPKGAFPTPPSQPLPYPPATYIINGLVFFLK